MNPLPALSRVVLSRSFTSGLISAIGVLAMGLLGYAVGGMAFAVPLGSGALTICFADNPAPLRVKTVELLFSTFAGGLYFALVWASLGRPWLQLLLVPLLGFGAGLVSLWGKRAVAMSFSLLFIAIITLGAYAAPDLPSYVLGVTNFLVGGLLYTGYALLLSRILRNRTKQQALAELLDALAAYMAWQSDFYQLQTADDETVGRAAALQGAANDALQSARDLVLRERERPLDAVWTRMLLDMLDLFEAQLAAQTDSLLLRQQFEGTDVLDALHAGTAQTASALSALALALLHSRELDAPAPDPARWIAVGRQGDDLLRAARTPQTEQARAALGSLLHTLREIDQWVQSLQATYASRDKAVDQPALPDVNLFVSAWRYEPRQLLAHLRLRSPIFRHAVRLGLSLLCGLLVARLLFAHQTHDYWILLTIAVILRPNYGVTRQRLKDRLLGTLIGCLFVAFLLNLHLGLPTLLGALFLALTFARTFVTTNFRFTAIAASVQSLLLARLLEGDVRFLVNQRLIDTVIGAALAWGFSYLLPRWEYQDAPSQVAALMRAQRDYAQAVLAVEQSDERTFRIARKHLFDTLAAITSLYVRMLEEPARQRRALRSLGRLITHSYLLAAHLASMRVLRAVRAKRLTRQAIDALIAPTRNGVLQQLAPTGSDTLGGLPISPDAFVAPGIADAGATVDPLARRLQLIGHEAALIREISQSVKFELHTPARDGPSN
ncbi:FUSC family membrane protein [Thiomonas sp. FB-Cd]|uniref:FUSC family protein n=1 Tax=Thiomonas sp. FB-Cd TaxID=1158292 RepID=UPI0009DE24E4|nr:FUSC family membrane protein [Thiomonas sp. FB-Cd]